MEWNSLLSTKRLKELEPEPHEFEKYPINQFERDYNRIVSSPAFRRLQDKTQVFPLDKSDFVRTRLTHSIEVSTIARQLGIMVSNNLTPFLQPDMHEHSEEISSVLLCAGLLHDLGNPPFGHFGETTIGDWFKNNLGVIKFRGKELSNVLTKQMQNDLTNFEGNAQALRILLKARYGAEINLSYSIISTLVKYPVNSTSFNKAAKNISEHKLGYYYAEQELLREISNEIGTLGSEGVIYRHPLTFLLEAADDIAYATADLEDAFKKGLFRLDQLIEFWNHYLDRQEFASTSALNYSLQFVDQLKNERGKNMSEERAFASWIDWARRWLMYVAAYSFSKNYNSIMNGKYQNDLFVGTFHEISINMLKDTMKEYVFDDVGILKLELSSQTILSFLLDKFVHAVLYYECEGKDSKEQLSKADKKLLAIFSKNYIDDYKNQKTGDEVKDLYFRILMVTDYISGMTDSFARTLYRELSGIE